MPTPGFDINELKRRMQGATQSLKHELGGLRTGGAGGLHAGARAGGSLRPAYAAFNQLAYRQRARAAAALGAGVVRRWSALPRRRSPIRISA